MCYPLRCAILHKLHIAEHAPFTTRHRISCDKFFTLYWKIEKQSVILKGLVKP